MKTVMITGASGFIGMKLTKVLLDKGIKVIAVVPNPEVMIEFETNPLFSIIKASFSEFETISRHTLIEKPDVFFYLSWFGYGASTNDYAVQIQNVKPVCDAVVQSSLLGCRRFVFASSFSEYMIRENELKTHDSGAACNVYGSVKKATRLIAHSVASQNNVDFISVAFANTFGPGDYSKRSSNLIISRLLQGKTLDITEGIHLYDWNFINDTVNGLILAGEKGKKDSVYYIGSNQRRPLRDIVLEVRNIINPKVNVNFGTYKEDFHVDYSSVDTHLLYRDTGYIASCDFKESVLQTAEWIQKAGIIL